MPNNLTNMRILDKLQPIMNTPYYTDNIMVNGDFTSSTGWNIFDSHVTIANGVLNFDGSQAAYSVAYRSKLTVVGQWYLNRHTIVSRTLGSVCAGNQHYRSTTGTYSQVFRASATNEGGVTCGSTFAGVIDDVMNFPFVLSSLFTYIIKLSVNQTLSADFAINTDMPAGFVLNLDSPSDPRNFVIVWIGYHNSSTINIKVEKCVNGVYTTLSDTSITYVDYRNLKVTKNGLTYTVYYNDILVGSSVSVLDTDNIAGNRYYGVFNTDATNIYKNYIVK